MRNLPHGLVNKCQNHEDDCANFCSLLRKAELYIQMIGFLTSNLSVGVSGSCQEGSITCRFQIGNLGINV